MDRRFQRTIEKFDCLNCSFEVRGDGYTNHCPRCLWSRHVDVHPGDRHAECRGMMEPIALDGQLGDFRILHRCQICGLEHWNQTAPDDDFEALLALARERGAPQ